MRDTAWVKRSCARATFACMQVAIELADAVTAPTDYMLSWYSQRGWALPPVATVVPNVLAGDAAAAQVREKPVWRVVFFGRLEERKGLVRARAP